MRVAIVNDLPLAVEALRRVVAAEPGFEVAWVAADGLQAVERCALDRPDLVLMDLFMPRMDGVQATRQIMQGAACAVLVVTASVQAATAEVFQALAAGALDVLDTPTLDGSGSAAGADRLTAKLRAMRSLVAAARRPSVPLAALPASGLPVIRGQDMLLALGASTGGPGTVAAILAALKDQCLQRRTELPATVVVQHIDAAFAPGLANWLAGACGWPVRLARDGETPQPGEVALAPASGHLVLRPRARFENRQGPSDLPYIPSVDEFFHSCRNWPGAGVAALLTGMGHDGAQGLRFLKDRGWTTLVQSLPTCAVAGMPGAAIALDAAQHILAPGQMAECILTQLRAGARP